jgi:hypothetical protein
MKKILFAFLIQMSFAAFAGDLYFVCEDEQNDDFLSATIEDGKATLMLVVQQGQPLLVEVLQKNTNSTSVFDLKVRALRLNRTEDIELTLFEEVALGQYICLIRD